MEIRQANINHLEAVAQLFNQYRIFYDMPSALEACKDFIEKRIRKDESVIFIAINDEGETTGFTQLYPSFCSVELKPILYLYDLYVAPPFRRRGIGKALMQAAKTYGEKINVDRLTLETARDNISAQMLYDSVSYQRDNEFYTYHFEIE